MIDRQGLPAYIHMPEGGRAFLNLNLDLYGKWCAAYVAYFGADEEGFERSKIIKPYVNGFDTPDEALKQLQKSIETYKP